MQQVYLGSTGLLVSELGLGTANFGNEVAQEPDAFALLDAFADAGGTLLDTANTYGGGRSEQILGRWLRRRDTAGTMVVATKLSGRIGPGPNDAGLSRRAILTAVEDSLRRLDRDHVDILFTHLWDPGAPAEETLSTLHDVVRAGKARYLGVSNYSGWQVAHQVLTSRLHGWEEFACVQPEYNLLSRAVEWEVLPAAGQFGMGLLAWSPLGGGWLTGKHTPAGAAPGSRVADIVQDWQPESWLRRAAVPTTWPTVEAVRTVAAGHDGATPGQAAINWLRAQPLVTAPILGARTVAQLQDSLGCLAWWPGPDELAELTRVSTPDAPYPYQFIEHNAAERRSHRRSGVQRG